MTRSSALAGLEQLPGRVGAEDAKRPALRELDRLADEARSMGAVEGAVVGFSRSWFRALARLLLDSAMRRDHGALARADEELRRLYGEFLKGSNAEALSAVDDGSTGAHWIHWLRSMLEMNTAALERVQPDVDSSWIQPGSLVERVLMQIAVSPGGSNQELLEQLGLSVDDDKSKLSRALGKINARGLAERSRVGNRACWQLTPRGRYVQGRVAQRFAPPSSERNASDQTRLSAVGDAWSPQVTDAILARIHRDLEDNDTGRFTSSARSRVMANFGKLGHEAISSKTLATTHEKNDTLRSGRAAALTRR